MECWSLPTPGPVTGPDVSQPTSGGPQGPKFPAGPWFPQELRWLPRAAGHLELEGK